MDISIIGTIILAIIALFIILQWHSNKTYKPSVNDIINIIQSSIDGTIDIAAFDEFTSVYIAYRKDLESIRNKYIQIVTSAENLDNDGATDIIVPLNSTGKQKLKGLINELSAQST